MNSAFLEQLETRSHIREISRKTGINVSLIHRWVKKLEKQGAVVSEVLGRKKYVVLNPYNPAANAFRESVKAQRVQNVVGPFMPSVYGFVYELMREFKRKVKSIVLFGSIPKAKGLMRDVKRSDVDMIIVMDKLPKNIMKRADLFMNVVKKCEWRYHCRYHIIAYTPQELARKDPLIDEIRKNSRIVILDKGGVWDE